MAATLLIELGTEELPPRSLKALAESFQELLTKSLSQHGLLDHHCQAQSFATPRRLAVSISSVLDQAPDLSERVTGPPATAPSNAVAGFARKHGVEVTRLIVEDMTKGRFYVLNRTRSGFSLDEFLKQQLESLLKGLPIPKLMR